MEPTFKVASIFAESFTFLNMVGMEYEQAVNTYVKALLDIATILHTHREARTEFDPGFLIRIIHDGFLQAVSDADRNRLLHDYHTDESFLVWYGELPGQKMNWNCIGWILPFRSIEETERAYELITRAELARKSWAKVRLFLFSCQLKFHGESINIPTNIVKVRVKGQEFRSALRVLRKSPPNLRYLTKTVIDRLSPSNYFRKRTHVKLVIGEKIVGEKVGPYAQEHSKNDLSGRH